MDLAVYISELLGLEGEVNLPGIGCFTQVRINGYYNDQENKFYPPGHEVSFDPKFKEDENLAKFISTKKNISLASSKYFIDKYATGLKQQLTSRNPEIAGLGYLYINGAVVAFKADTSKSSDPSFYGFQPLDIPAPVTKPVAEQKVKADEEITSTPIEEVPVRPLEEKIPAHEPTIIEKTEEEQETEEEYVYEEPRSTRGSLWVTLLLILIIVLLSVMGLYKYKPEWFNLQEKPQTYVVVKSSDTAASATTDTSKTIASTDSTTKAAAQSVAANQNTKPADTAQSVHWEVMAGSFGTKKAAEIAMKFYKENGIDTKITTDVPGKLIKLSFGTYYSEVEAEKAKSDLLKTGKVDKGIYTLKINPKK
jgi:cell division protein FtsN